MKNLNELINGENKSLYYDDLIEIYDDIKKTLQFQECEVVLLKNTLFTLNEYRGEKHLMNGFRSVSIEPLRIFKGILFLYSIAISDTDIKIHGYELNDKMIEENSYDYYGINFNKENYFKNEVNDLSNKLKNIYNFEDDNIISILEEKVKVLKKKKREMSKPKTITISSKMHNKVKQHCNEINLKINDWVEKVLSEEINQHKEKNSNIIQVVDKEEKENEIYENFMKSGIATNLIKSDKLIFLPNFKFIGISILDHKPIYDYVGKMDIINNGKFKDCNIVTVSLSKDKISSIYPEDIIDTLDIVSSFRDNSKDKISSIYPKD